MWPLRRLALFPRCGGALLQPSERRKRWSTSSICRQGRGSSRGPGGASRRIVLGACRIGIPARRRPRGREGMLGVRSTTILPYCTITSSSLDADRGRLEDHLSRSGWSWDRCGRCRRSRPAEAGEQQGVRHVLPRRESDALRVLGREQESSLGSTPASWSRLPTGVPTSCGTGLGRTASVLTEASQHTAPLRRETKQPRRAHSGGPSR